MEMQFDSSPCLAPHTFGAVSLELDNMGGTPDRTGQDWDSEMEGDHHTCYFACHHTHTCFLGINISSLPPSPPWDCSFPHLLFCTFCALHAFQTSPVALALASILKHYLPSPSSLHALPSACAFYGEWTVAFLGGGTDTTCL